MTNLRHVLFALLLATCLASCSNDESEVGAEDSVTIGDSSSANDPDPNDDGKVTYEEQSAQGSITANTTNYADRADSIRARRDTLVTPRYTDNEYEAAFSTSTTNPRNQVEGGITPGEQQKGNQ